MKKPGAFGTGWAHASWGFAEMVVGEKGFEPAPTFQAFSSHQQLNLNDLISRYREFVPNAGDTIRTTLSLPLLRLRAKAFQDRPPVEV